MCLKKTKLLIGIYCPPFAEIIDISRTLNSLQLSAGQVRRKVIVFIDGGNLNQNNIKELLGFSVVKTDAYLGKAFCFNKLITYEGADYFLFLEAGIRLGPDCLCLLITSLQNNKENGLAGPSINRSWNEQSTIFPKYLTNNYRHTSEVVGKQFKSEYMELDPLYSLSDCCYLVKMEVIDAIGLADEEYGTGSCWEMDFNIRAARSGFRGIWVKGAYAERALNWPHEDLQLSRQIYQNRFCALQKRENVPYKAHCRGDKCGNFAIPSKTRLKIDFIYDRVEVPYENFIVAMPLVSCVMPTAKRAPFVKRAIEFFEQQSYPRKELIIVYNEYSDLPIDINRADGLKFVKSECMSIGGKRNEGCANSNGNIIVQWDDDDLYHPERIYAQVSPILRGECEMTGLNNFLFYEENTGKYWACSEDLFSRLFIENVAAGTLAFVKSVWENSATYPAISLREDCEFLCAAMKKGARLQRIDGRDLFIYFRHSCNSWRFKAGHYLKAEEWLQWSFSEKGSTAAFDSLIKTRLI